jgi:hypothetical protein
MPTALAKALNSSKQAGRPRRLPKRMKGPDHRGLQHVFAIEGDRSYVDRGINTTIDSTTIGSKVIEGGGEETAYPFDVTFPIHTDRFRYISTKFKAAGIGHAA